jgi:hypothetical protein
VELSVGAATFDAATCTVTRAAATSCLVRNCHIEAYTRARIPLVGLLSGETGICGTTVLHAELSVGAV